MEFFSMAPKYGSREIFLFFPNEQTASAFVEWIRNKQTGFTIAKPIQCNCNETDMYHVVAKLFDYQVKKLYRILDEFFKKEKIRVGGKLWWKLFFNRFLRE